MTEKDQKLIVGIGVFKVARSPGIIEAFSLGSCVGVALYDSERKVGGMAHIMLPDSTGASNSDPAKFADTALPMMIAEMEKLGARKNRLTAKIAGGASMFIAVVKDPLFSIGDKNVAAVKKHLEAAGIPITGADTGFNWGRTMEFYVETGVVTVKSLQKGVKTI